MKILHNCSRFPIPYHNVVHRANYPFLNNFFFFATIFLAYPPLYPGARLSHWRYSAAAFPADLNRACVSAATRKTRGPQSASRDFRGGVCTGAGNFIPAGDPVPRFRDVSPFFFPSPIIRRGGTTVAKGLARRDYRTLLRGRIRRYMGMS